MRKIVISPDFTDLASSIKQIPEMVRKGQGKLLFKGRNKLILFENIHLGNNTVKIVVKCFKRNGFLKKAIYTWLRKNKAARCYKNAQEIKRRGFLTPQEIAYIEEYKGGLLDQVYYLCEYSSWCPINDYNTDNKNFDHTFVADFAAFVAELHLHGVIHHDLNSTNVNYCKKGNHYIFSLIDINRMTFYSHEAPIKESLENLTLFSDISSLYLYFLKCYVKKRNNPEINFEKCLTIKKRHDRNRKRKKSFTNLFKKRKPLDNKNK